MQKIISLRLLPSEAASDSIVKKYLAQALAVRLSSITGYNLIKHSIDARGKQPVIQLSVTDVDRVHPACSTL